MENHATSARLAHLALAAAGIIAVTVLAATVKVGRDMARYLETSSALTAEGAVTDSAPGSGGAVPEAPGATVDPAIAPAAMVDTRSEDAAELRRVSNRAVAAAP